MSMTSTAATAEAGVIPPDTFGIRVAIARTALGLNYDRLSDACHELGTPINSETFRRWEHGMTQCSNPERAARVMALIPLPNGKGYLSWEWIAYGGPLPAEHVEQVPGSTQEPLTGWRARVA